jgi:hypothetical protein
VGLSESGKYDMKKYGGVRRTGKGKKARTMANFFTTYSDSYRRCDPVSVFTHFVSIPSTLQLYRVSQAIESTPFLKSGNVFACPDTHLSFHFQMKTIVNIQSSI